MDNGGATTMAIELLLGHTSQALEADMEDLEALRLATEAEMREAGSGGGAASNLTPRTRYDQRIRALEDDALKIVNQVNMSTFRRQFQTQKGQVDITNFVSMMQRALSNNRAKVAAARKNKGRGHRDSYANSSNNSSGTNQQGHNNQSSVDIHGHEMIARLIELFREIDLDGDGLIVWDEFTTHIVSKAMRFTGLGVGANEALKYQHNHNIDPLTRFRHKGLLDKLVAIPRRNYLAAIEQRCPTITLYNCKTGSVVNTLNSPAPPVTMAYVESLHVLVTANSDTTLMAWNLDEGPLRTRWQVRAKWPAPCTMMSLAWVPSKRLLYSGATTGLIYAWDMEEREQRACLRGGHRDIVFDLLSIDHLDLVASASLDASICLWDAYLGTQRQRLLGHKKGVFSLAYSMGHRLLFSAGFDHEAYVWSPFTSTPVYRLKGHTASMVGVVAVEDRPQVITADATGTLKLWDLRNFRCMQTFSTDHAAGDVNDLRGMTCMVHTMLDHTQPRLVVGTKRISFLDQLRVKTDPFTDDLPIACATYNDVCLTIITAAGRNIKVWDALLGTVRSAFLEVAVADVSAICMDHRKRKIIAGDIQGSVQVYNHQTGALMKSFAKRETPSTSRTPPPGVTKLVYLASRRHVLVGYADSAILIYDETVIQCCPCLLEFDPAMRNQGDLAAMAISLAPGSVHMVSASGRPGDAIKLWNHETAKCEASLTMQTPSSYAILSLIFLNPLPLLAVCCSDAVIRIWATWGIRMGKRLCLLEILNALPPMFHPYSTGTSAQYPIWRDSAHHTNGDVSSSDDAADLEALRNHWRQAGGGRRVSGASFAPPLELNRGAPVLCLAWDEESSSLFSGDDKGQVRRWDLAPFLAELARMRLLYQGTSGQEKWYTGSLSEMDATQAQQCLSSIIKKAASFAPLVYSIEAHQDAVLTLEVTKEPRALLSASSDQCARMWGLDGTSIGTLIQGLPLDIKNPGWDLPLDVASRQARDEAEIVAVKEGLQERHHKRKASAAAARKHHQRPQHVTISNSRTISPISTDIMTTAGFSGDFATTGISSGHSYSTTGRQSLHSTSRSGGSRDADHSRHAAIMHVLETVRSYATVTAPVVDPQLPQSPRGRLGRMASEGSSVSGGSARQVDGRSSPNSRSFKRGASTMRLPSLTSAPPPRLGALSSLLTTDGDDVGSSVADGQQQQGQDQQQQPPPQTPTSPSRPVVPALTSTFKRVAPVSSMMPPSPGRRQSDARQADVEAKIQRLRFKLREIDRSTSEDISPLDGGKGVGGSRPTTAAQQEQGQGKGGEGVVEGGHDGGQHERLSSGSSSLASRPSSAA